MRNVALIRNGSVTHSTNNDQRFVGLSIEARSGNTLTLSAPPSGGVAPPAKAVELYPELVHVALYSWLTEPRGQATFTNAIYVQLDGFPEPSGLG